MSDKTRVTLTLTPDQAHAVSEALDVYMRLCLGQLNIVAEMVSDERIPLRNASCIDREVASFEVCDQVRADIDRVKSALGFSIGASLGVGHPHVHVTGTRSYEVMKVLDKVLANHRNPNPEFRGVDYDGLTVRYTSDPMPEVAIRHAGGPDDVAKAFAIADQSLIELLSSECMHCDEHGLVLAVIGEDGNPIQSIAETPAHIQDAVTWLTNRKLATVVAGPEGDEVIILSEG